MCRVLGMCLQIFKQTESPNPLIGPKALSLHKIVRLLVLTCFVVGLAGPRMALAQSFEDLVARLEMYPSLTALEYQAQASEERGVAATALPDPVVSLGINNFPLLEPSFTDFLPTHKAVGVRQDFPNRSGRQASAGEQRALAAQTALTREAQRAQLEAGLISLLHRKATVNGQRRLAQERNAKYDELANVVKAEIDAGRPAVYRLAEIEAERTDVTRTLIDLDRADAEISAQLIDLIGIDTQIAPPELTPKDWSGKAKDFHLVRIADAAIRVAEYGIDRAEAGWRPNWGAQVTYQQRESGRNFAGTDWVSAGLTFTVPLWAESSQTPKLRAARAEYASAEMRFQAAAKRAAAQYQIQDAAWKAARDNISALRSNIAAIEDEIESQRSTFESGAGDYAPIIDAEIAILKLLSDIAGEEARMATAIASLNALQVSP